MRQIDGIDEDVWFELRAADALELMKKDNALPLDDAATRIMMPHMAKLDVSLDKAVLMIAVLVEGAVHYSEHGTHDDAIAWLRGN